MHEAATKQGCLMTSTTVAKLVALAESTKETTWLCRLLKSLDAEQELPTIVYCDNQAAIALIKYPEYHRRTKHIDMKYFAICEQYENRFMDFQYIHTNEKIVDTLTKSLPCDAFQRLRSLLGLRQFTKNEWETR